MLRGAVFDLNGTMIFDDPIQEEVWRTWARTHLCRELSDDDFAFHLHGVNNRECVKFLLGRTPTPDECASIQAEREQCYRDLCVAHADDLYCFAPGLPEFLDSLAEQGIALNIATASPYENMVFHFEQLDLSRWFSLDTISYDGPDVPAKPDPTIFLRAMERIGIEPGACAVFEDSLSGLEAARRSGAGRIIAVASGLAPAILAELPGVNAVISDYRDADTLVA